jgi:phosphoribosyl-AMP cyclohydrolase
MKEECFASSGAAEEKPGNEEVEDVSLSPEELFALQPVWPVIVVEKKTRRVISLQEVNLEAFLKTISTGKCWYYDRVNDLIYLKGEHSREVETIRKITLDACHARRHLRNLHYLVDVEDGECLFGMSRCDFYHFDNGKFQLDTSCVKEQGACQKHWKRVNTILGEKEDAEHQKRFVK